MSVRQSVHRSEHGSEEALQQPSVLVPYPGPDPSPKTQDIFVYLRPETNGVVGESAILKVMQQCPDYKIDIHLVYLANIPGGFIVQNHIVERHYACKLYFAAHGKAAFTPGMRREFTAYFGMPFEEAPVVGSFEALRLLGLRPNELFEQWVGESDFFTTAGQTVKRIGEYFVVNYDMPALLHKNNRDTDVAAMVFRTTRDYAYFDRLLCEMRSALIDAGIMSPNHPMGRAMHYSKSPFEQVLDGLGYLYTAGGASVDPTQFSFCAYLAQQGIDIQSVMGALSHPVARFRDSNGTIVEDELVSFTYHDSYPDAACKLRSMISQYILLE
jgi:hypothetical protein